MAFEPPPPPNPQALHQFPELPAELQDKIWGCAASNPSIVYLRLGKYSYTIFAHPRAITGASENAIRPSEQALTAYQTNETNTKKQKYFSLSQDVFFLQYFGGWFGSPEALQLMRELPGLETIDGYGVNQIPPQPRGNFISSFIPPGNGGFSMPISFLHHSPPWSGLIENVAVQLSLIPFDFQFGTEDQIETNPESRRLKMGLPSYFYVLADPIPDDYRSNLKIWAFQAVADFLRNAIEYCRWNFPLLKIIYFVIPHKEPAYEKENCYKYRGFSYPKNGYQALRHWSEVDGLVYNEKECKLIEQEMILWTWGRIGLTPSIGGDGQYSYPQPNKSDLPEFKLVGAVEFEKKVVKMAEDPWETRLGGVLSGLFDEESSP